MVGLPSFESDHRHGYHNGAFCSSCALCEKEKERRLNYEAQTNFLGIVYAEGVLKPLDPNAQRCRAEVSYQLPNGLERAGFYYVYVPMIESDDLEFHPATLATAAFDDRLDEYLYFSVDEIYPA